VNKGSMLFPAKTLRSNPDSYRDAKVSLGVFALIFAPLRDN